MFFFFFLNIFFNEENHHSRSRKFLEFVYAQSTNHTHHLITLGLLWMKPVYSLNYKKDKKKLPFNED